MQKYPKIDSIYKRDERGRFLVGQFSQPAFAYLQDNQWEWSEKVDGTNIRVMWDGARVTYGGKTDNAQIPAKLITRLQEHFSEKALTWFTERSGSVCLYGEGYGASIQKGGGNYKTDGVDFVLFDVLIDHWWLERENVDAIATTLNLPIVPIVGRGTLHEAMDMAVRGFTSQWGNFRAEGLVAKPLVSLCNRAGERVITKVKWLDFR